MQHKADLETLNYIRSRIPEVECKPGCTACCGTGVWSKFEWSQLSQEQRDSYDFHSFNCSFKTGENGFCSVHEHRPMLCRIYGVTEGIPCQQGVPGKSYLDKETANSLMTLYRNVFFNEEL